MALTFHRLVQRDLRTILGYYESVSGTLLADRSVAQKLDLMERLWADLSANDKDLPSPEWHGTVIADRLQAVEEGQARYGDWDEAKARLRRELP